MHHFFESESDLKATKTLVQSKRTQQYFFQRWSRGRKARGLGHKKIRDQGQGQPFQGQNLSRPRTGMLEAKDQGHSRKCSPKKKKVFQAISNL